MSQKFDFSSLEAQPSKFDFSHLNSSNDLSNNPIQQDNQMQGPFAQWTLPGLKAQWQGIKQGGREIGQGVEQAAAWLGKGLGLESPEDYDSLTKAIQSQHESWVKNQGSNPIAEQLRGRTKQLPLALALAGVGPEFSLLNAVKSGAIGAGVGATQFVAPGESRGTNALVGALEGAALPVGAAGARGVGNIFKYAFHKGSPQKTAAFIQAGHDLLSNQAGNLYNYVENEAAKRGIDKLPIPDKIIEDARQFFPKTDASKNLIDAAKTGDYKSIRKLQSDLRKRGEKLKSSDYAADRDRGEEALDKRDKINEEVANTFDVFGHPDLKENLSQANKIYRNLKETYYSHPTISKLVNPELRKVPKNINETVMEISKPMERIRQAHPELENEVNMAEKKKKAIKLLSALGLATGGGVAGSYVTQHGKNISLLKDLLENQ